MSAVLPVPQIEVPPTRSKQLFDGAVQHIYSFANGYSASVINGPYTYGGRAGLWELAVLRDGDLAYDTPITPDVEGYLTDANVADLLVRIAALPVPSKGVEA